MDDELEWIDPEHPDVNEAATATARLLLRIHEQRLRPPAEIDSTDVPATVFQSAFFFPWIDRARSWIVSQSPARKAIAFKILSLREAILQLLFSVEMASTRRMLDQIGKQMRAW